VNINVQLPSLPPLNLAPTTESARRDTQSREVIPQPPASNPSRSENRTPSDQNPSRNVSKDVATAVYFHESLQVNDSEHANHARIEGDKGQGQASHQEKGSSGSQNEQQESQTKQTETESKQVQQENKQDKQEQVKIDSLQARHQEVVTHEQAHRSVGGQFAGAASYDYEKGPDGRSYAVSGEVSIDISVVAGDPQATVQKMQQVRQAALAPASPSNQDRMVAAQASKIEQSARVELQMSPVSNESKKSSLDESEDNSKAESLSSDKTTEGISQGSPPAELSATNFPASGSGINDTTYDESVAFSQTRNLYSNSVKASNDIDGIVLNDIKSARITGQTQLQSQVVGNRYNQSYQSATPASLDIAV